MLLHGHIALVSPSLLEICPQIWAHKGYAHEDWLDKLSQVIDLCFLECLHDAVRPLRISHIGFVPRLLCSSAKLMKTSAARVPEIRNPLVVHLSILQLHLSLFFFRFFAGLILNLLEHTSTFIIEFASRFCFVWLALWRMPKITR